MIRLLFIGALILLAGCTDQVDSQVSGGEFTVHFSDPGDKELAEKLVHFWKEEGLITGKNQDVKLVRGKAGYDLYLISATRKSKEEMTFDEIKSLSMLKGNLERKIFVKNDIRIVITDDAFKPIFTPDL